MRNLTLGDLKVGVTELLTTKKALLEASGAGRLYGPVLARQLEQIDALPEELTGGLPLARDLAAADGLHDALGEAVWHVCVAYERNPQAPAAQRQAATAIREAFVPGLSELERSYADQAKVAEERRASLDSLAGELASIPVGDGQHLGAWVEAFLDSARALQNLLNRRDQYKAVDMDARRQSGALRGATIDVLRRLRAALHDEAKLKGAGLDEDYEAKLFGAFDELEAVRASE